MDNPHGKIMMKVEICPADIVSHHINDKTNKFIIQPFEESKIEILFIIREVVVSQSFFRFEKFVQDCEENMEIQLWIDVPQTFSKI